MSGNIPPGRSAGSALPSRNIHIPEQKAVPVQIKISTRHGHLSTDSQEKIQAKLEKLGRLFERLTEIELTVDLEDSASPAVELKVNAEHKHDFVAKDTADELAPAIDGVIHKIEQQIRKYKERVQEHRGPGLRQQAASAEGGAETDE